MMRTLEMQDNRKIGLFILLVLLVHCIAFQIGKADDNNTIIRSLETNYNQNNYETIFQTFSPEMQKALPLEATVKFFADLKSQVGNITKWEFIKEGQTIFSYKTTFEKGEFIIDLSINNLSKISGLFIRQSVKDVFPIIERNKTELILPFTDEWYIVWGGDTIDLNYHIENKAQKNAFDFVVIGENGKTYKTNGLINEDYYAFGKEMIAPCDGEIVLVVDGIKDNQPGNKNSYYVPGNTVIIKTINAEYILLAHFKQNSIIVKEKQLVKKGDLLGYCGNSGNSSEPHLHFHIQNIEDMNEATGVKCYFSNIIVNGNEVTNYSPIKNDKIKNK
ncbi:MAG: peptidoglycan DD-metalloendopeptidase family protein [Planctomycetaceae bacterium]|nr:peptidoglycan DD-metalloendopeptidase family protein [Planctomycetaceae bacterium]